MCKGLVTRWSRLPCKSRYRILTEEDGNSDLCLKTNQKSFVQRMELYIGTHTYREKCVVFCNTVVIFVVHVGGMSLNCSHQRAYYSSPKWYVSMKGNDGMILTWENLRSRRRTCPSATLSTTKLTWTIPGANLSLRSERPAINRLSHDTTFVTFHAVKKFCWNVKYFTFSLWF
jgi:hypothetical protein